MIEENGRQSVRKIENGLVVDHLDPKITWKLAELLDLRKYGDRVTLGNHYRSGKVVGGEKGFLKIEGRGLSDYEMNLISLIAPNATVNIIQNGEVVDKRQVEIPGVLEGIVDCPNLGCVSHREGEKFPSVIRYHGGIFTCHYCRADFLREDISL